MLHFSISVFWPGLSRRGQIPRDWLRQRRRRICTRDGQHQGKGICSRTPGWRRNSLAGPLRFVRHHGTQVFGVRASRVGALRSESRPEIWRRRSGGRRCWWPRWPGSICRQSGHAGVRPVISRRFFDAAGYRRHRRRAACRRTRFGHRHPSPGDLDRTHRRTRSDGATPTQYHCAACTPGRSHPANSVPADELRMRPDCSGLAWAIATNHRAVASLIADGGPTDRRGVAGVATRPDHQRIERSDRSGGQQYDHRRVTAGVD